MSNPALTVEYIERSNKQGEKKMAQKKLTYYAKTAEQNASPRQLHSLKLRTGEDWRGKRLSKLDATRLITPLKRGEWRKARAKLEEHGYIQPEIDKILDIAEDKLKEEQKEQSKEQGEMEPETTPWDQEQDSGQTQKETETGHGGEEVEFTKKLNETLNILNDNIKKDIEQEIKGIVQGKVEELKKNNKGPQQYDPQEQEYFKPAIFDRVCSYLDAGLNVLIYGPAGCGKSKLAEQVAYAMNKEFYQNSFSGGARYRQVFGSTHMMTDEHGNQVTDFKPTEFMNCMTREDMLVLGDELFSLDPEAAQGLNGFLEPNNAKVETPAGTFHKKAAFIGTANTAGRANSRQYTAPQRQDDSLLDRFIAVYMDYDEKVEQSILKGMGVDQQTVDFFVERTKNIRQQAKLHSVPFDASTRRLINAAKAYLVINDAEQAFEDAMFASLSDTERRSLGV